MKTESIFKIVEKHTTVTRQMIVSDNGHDHVRRARYMSSALMSHFLHMEHKDIAGEMNKSRPTITYHIRKHVESMQVNHDYRSTYNSCIGDLESYEEPQMDCEQVYKELKKLELRVKKLEA